MTWYKINPIYRGGGNPAPFYFWEYLMEKAKLGTVEYSLRCDGLYNKWEYLPDHGDYLCPVWVITDVVYDVPKYANAVTPLEKKAA